jgi:hypothetical protein
MKEWIPNWCHVLRYIIIVEVLPHWEDAPPRKWIPANAWPSSCADSGRIQPELPSSGGWFPTVDSSIIFGDSVTPHAVNSSRRGIDPLLTGATRVFNPNDCQADQAQNWHDNFSFQLNYDIRSLMIYISQRLTSIALKAQERSCNYGNFIDIGLAGHWLSQLQHWMLIESTRGIW